MSAKVDLKYLELRLRGGKTCRTPYWVIDSGAAGPGLLVTAAMHGNEVQGSEAIRLFANEAPARLVRGKLILMPFANLLAVRNRRPHITSRLGDLYSGGEPDNLNCRWPGDPNGNEADQLAHLMHQEVVAQATHLIDLHTYNRFFHPVVYPAKGCAPSLELAQVCGIRFIQALEWHPEVKERPVLPCTLSHYFNDTGRCGVSVEFSGQYDVCKDQVRLGHRLLMNCTRHLGLFAGRPDLPEQPPIRLDQVQMRTVNAPCSGLFVGCDFKPGDPVKKDAVLGHIVKDTDLSVVEVRAPLSGVLYIYGCHRRHCDLDLADMHPFADRGDTLASIAPAG